MKYLILTAATLMLVPPAIHAAAGPVDGAPEQPSYTGHRLHIIGTKTWRNADSLGDGPSVRVAFDPHMIDEADGVRVDADGRFHLLGPVGHVTFKALELKRATKFLRVLLAAEGGMKYRMEMRHRTAATEFLWMSWKGAWKSWGPVPAAGSFVVPNGEKSGEFQFRLELAPEGAKAVPMKVSYVDLMIDPAAARQTGTITPRPRKEPARIAKAASAESGSRGRGNPLRIISRAEWGARRSLVENDPGWAQNRITGIVIHHSASPSVDDVNKHGDLAMIQSIQRFHMSDRGWSDVAYHYLITPDGQIYEGVPENIEGSHMRANNNGWLGICLLGHFSSERDFSRSSAGRKRMWQLVEHLSKKYHVPRSNVVGHEDFQPGRDCPGTHLYREMQKFRNGSRKDSLHAD